MWPVIIRELRAGSRQWGTYWLRVLAAAFGIGAFVLFMEQGRGVRTGGEGAELFATLHRILLATIAVVVPLMTTDCISRERREGTLGLLFLTNLTAHGIILAKAIAHGLRAWALWAAVLPLMALPVLLGGVEWREVALSSCYSLEFIGMNLVVGLVASAFTRSQAAAVCAAVCLSVLAINLFAVGNMWTVGWLLNIGLAGPLQFLEATDLSQAIQFVGDVNHQEADIFSNKADPGAQFALWVGTLIFALLVALISLAVLWVTAWHLRRNWQDKPKTKKQTEVEKFFCSPVFMTGLFRAWMRRSIERNPIGWLQKRSWTGRITAWIWLAVMISFASALASSLGRDAVGGFNVLMWLLLGSMAYVAAGSFRRERETGALELILVTPLSERHIVLGRLRGLWSQFLPTFAIWIAVVLYMSSALQDWQLTNMLRFTVAYLIVPVVGLYFSLRSRFVLLAWLATLVACFALPQLLWWMFYFVLPIFFGSGVPILLSPSLMHLQLFITLPVQLALAAFLLWRLRLNLARRTFSLR